MAVIPDDFRDLLEKKGFAHMATLGPMGEPHSSPVWYEFDGERVLVSSRRSRQKCTNLTRDPRVSLSILDPEEPYRFLEIRGRAEIVDDPEASLIHRLAQKYYGSDRFENPGDDRVIFKITPERATWRRP